MSYYYRHPSQIAVVPDSKEAFDLFITQVLSKEFNAAAVDRTGNLNNFSEILDAIPEPKIDKLDFNKVVDERARDIVNRALAYNKDIRMEWNGSLPSTVILVSITNHLATLTIRPNVTVFTTSKAETRRVEIHKKFVLENEFVTENTGGVSAIKGDGSIGDYITIFDDCGQILFSVGYVEISDYERPFEDVCEPDLYTVLKPILDAKPAGWDNTLSTAIHWLGFVFKWQWATLTRYMKSPLPYEDINLFYNTISFQQWFMQVPVLEKHPELINKKSQWHCREYIKQYHYDETLDLCNFVTGRGYNNMESTERANPIEMKQKQCVGIDTEFNKIWQVKQKNLVEVEGAE